MSKRPSLALSALVISAILALALAACAARPKNIQPSIDELRRAPNHQASTFASDLAAALAKSVPERLGALPAAVLDIYRKADGRPDYATYSPSAEERELFARYFELLPSAFKAAMNDRLLGIYFIENFAGGGMSDFAFGPGKDSLYSVLILNPKVLRMSLVDWIAYRDASPYAADSSGVSLASACPGGENYFGLIHTLTHEAAHIYDYVNRATPFVEPALARLALGASDPAPKAADSTFARGVWEGYSKPVAAYAIPRRSETAAYGLGTALPVSVAGDQYRALASTPFASFYGSGSWAEDFAEAATWTYLKKKLGIRYEVAVLRGGKEELRFRPDASRWSEERKAAIEKAIGP
jgi:hypothetical protein